MQSFTDNTCIFYNDKTNVFHTSGLFEAKSKDDCPVHSSRFSSSECTSVFIFCIWSSST